MPLGALALLLAATLHDIAARTIPDQVSAAVALVGLADRLAGGGLVPALAAAGAVFVFAFLCWCRGWMGGGDVKLLAAATLLLPAGQPAALATLAYLCAVALAGGVLAGLYLLLRVVVSLPSGRRPVGLLARALRAERWRIRRGGPLPYAAAIAAGAGVMMFAGGPQ